jgi:archaellum component FlaC
MAVDIRLPNIDAKTPAEKQIKSYLIQMAEQLNWALKNIDTSNNTVVANPTPKSLLSSTQNTASSKSPEATFGSIKELIIKSADIVNAYYDSISERLQSEYEAISDFGTFKETVTRDITENATNTNNAFSHIQTINTNLSNVGESVGDVKKGLDDSVKALTDDIDELGTDLSNAKKNIDDEIKGIKDDIGSIETSIVEVSANIKSGLLYYDENEIPVYGLEIGQRNKVDGVEVFNKFARFTAGRLSFYDQNGTEVAYISDYKLYITNAEITGALKLGGYLVETTNGLTFKWVGRG